jgi:NAD+ synthase (glutamine-hydrolysing)
MNKFMDVRNHGFVRVAVAVPRVTLADPLANARTHFKMLQDAAEQGAYYVLFTELGLTGYSCGDLFHNDTLRRQATEALAWLLSEMDAHGLDTTVTVSLPLLVDDGLYNCAVTFQGSTILAVAPKAYPPEYREFYELRHFARASEARSTTIRLCGQEVPFGTDILIAAEDGSPFVLHTETCEDIWVPIPPSTHAALAGATVLANVSASNITIGKSEYREQLVLASSGKNIAVQLYSAAGPGESTTDVAWDGDGYIAERGSLIARTERFARDGALIVSDVDLASIVQDRMRQGSFRQNAADNRKAFRHVYCVPPTETGDVSMYLAFRRDIDAYPFVPSDPAKRDVRCRETFMIQATSLVRKLESVPPHLRKIVVGVSGGQDSTQALLVAARAMDIMGLPRTNILGVTMPGFGTTDRTYQNACRLIHSIGASFMEISIADLSTQTFKDTAGITDVPAFIAEIKSALAAKRQDADAKRIRTYFENVQARSRKHELYAISGWHGAIVLGTGDLSELLQGWCTLFGDHASDYGVNAGVPKTLISYLIRWTAEVIYGEEADVKACLMDILDTEISPELLPPDASGKIAQKTEDLIGPYALHDFTGHAVVRFGHGPARIARMQLHAFCDVYDLATIKRWLRSFHERFFGSQHKRSCLPEGPKIGVASISPRGDWRMPADAVVTAWLREIDTIPDSEY